MSLRRRFTALILSFVLLPSTVTGGRFGCLMSTSGTGNSAMAAMAEKHAAHVVQSVGEHRAHVGAAAISDDDSDSSRRVPHQPTECLSASACMGVALGAPTDLIVDALHRAADVTDDTALGPLSPAFALEPPPPRV
jgi:hypothetical protein